MTNRCNVAWSLAASLDELGDRPDRRLFPPGISSLRRIHTENLRYGGQALVLSLSTPISR
jgi:hypothetical protein